MCHLKVSNMPFITIFLFGILAAIFALIIELLLFGFIPDSLMISETLAFTNLVTLFGIALIEEVSGYIFLRQYALRFLSEKKWLAQDPLFLGVSFGIGFATLEILLIQNEMSKLPELAALGTAGIHIITSSMFAFTLFSSTTKHLSSGLILVAATLLHTLYNVIALTIL